MFRKRLSGRMPRPRGDTILSVMISVVIVGSVIGTTYYIVNSSLRLGRSAQERSAALNVINTQLERLKALLDVDPDIIFEDTPPPMGLGVKAASGFGLRFCLTLDEAASALANEPRVVIEVGGYDPAHPTDPDRSLIDGDCKGRGIGFPVADADAEVEIRYQAVNPSNADDTNRFVIRATWTTIGSDRRESLFDYYRSHPLLEI